MGLIADSLSNDVASSNFVSSYGFGGDGLSGDIFRSDGLSSDGFRSDGLSSDGLSRCVDRSKKTCNEHCKEPP